MNLLFDIGHPAHVHLFRNYINYLKEDGHSVFVVSRKKDVTELLLDHYKIEHFPVTAPKKTKLGMLQELQKRNKFIFDLHKKHKFYAAFGTSASIGFLNFRYGVPAYNFNEDDDDVIKYYAYLSYPFATKIINPDCITYRKWKEKRILYPSYHEFAYLHPNNFMRDHDLIKSYGLEPNKYVIIRLSALLAHHDGGMKGISGEMLNEIKQLLSPHKIIESAELKNDYQIKPWDMHQVLANANMIVSDSQTMTIEAAVLGVPAVRINTFIDKSTVINEIEKKYKLAFGIFPDQGDKIISTIKYLAENDSIKDLWKERLNKLLKEKIDFNEWMINYFNKEIKL